jgi:hypothetical protein
VAYVPYGWADGSSGLTPIVASRLNAMEAGIGTGAAGSSADALVAKLDQKRTTATLVVLGDSTSNETTEWVYLLASWLVTNYPTLKVAYRLYNSGTTSYDAAVNLGASTPDTTLTLYNGSVGSTTAAYPYAVGGRLAAMIPSAPDLVITNYGHNHTTDSAATFQATQDTLASNIRGLYAGTPIVVSSQNQEKSPATNATPHNDRQAAQRAYALTRGFGYIGAFEAFMGQSAPDSYVQSDGVHPTQTGSGDGQHLWLAAAQAHWSNLSLKP